MNSKIAVVMDVAGTMLRMYRVAKDPFVDSLLEYVVTIELIMQREGRALVVPKKDPALLDLCPPQLPIMAYIGKDLSSVEISCRSSPVSNEEAMDILRQSKSVIGDLKKTQEAVRMKCPGPYLTSGIIVDRQAWEVAYMVSTAGVPFPGLIQVLRQLEDMGVMVYVASGDSSRSLHRLKDYGLPLKHIYPVAAPERKRDLVMELKKTYTTVVMVGDGLNDVYAMEKSDFGVLSIQQPSHPPERLRLAADAVIDDIRHLPRLLGEFAVK